MHNRYGKFVKVHVNSIEDMYRVELNNEKIYYYHLPFRVAKVAIGYKLRGGGGGGRQDHVSI